MASKARRLKKSKDTRSTRARRAGLSVGLVAAAVGLFYIVRAAVRPVRPHTPSAVRTATSAWGASVTLDNLDYPQAVLATMKAIGRPLVVDLTDSPANWQPRKGIVFPSEALRLLGLEEHPGAGNKVGVLAALPNWQALADDLRRGLKKPLPLPGTSELTRLRALVYDHPERLSAKDREALATVARVGLEMRIQKRLEVLAKDRFAKGIVGITRAPTSGEAVGISFRFSNGLVARWPLGAEDSYVKDVPAARSLPQPEILSATQLTHRLEEHVRQHVQFDPPLMAAAQFAVAITASEAREAVAALAYMDGRKVSIQGNQWILKRRDNRARLTRDRRISHQFALRHANEAAHQLGSLSAVAHRGTTLIPISRTACQVQATLHDALVAKLVCESMADWDLHHAPLSSGKVVADRKARTAPYLLYRGISVSLTPLKRAGQSARHPKRRQPTDK